MNLTGYNARLYFEACRISFYKSSKLILKKCKLSCHEEKLGMCHVEFSFNTLMVSKVKTKTDLCCTEELMPSYCGLQIITGFGRSQY